MKIPELRQKLSGLSEKELIYLAVEFYKLIPKSKREMYQLDAMTETPDPASKPSKLQGSVETIADMERKIIEFVHNAEAGYYFRNNREVSKKERRTWRSRVKSWYKALTSINRPDADLNKQAQLLTLLYLCLRQGKRYTLFTSHEPFEAINIEQAKFYTGILDLYEHVSGKSEVIKKGTELLVQSAEDSYMATQLIDEFLLLISIPDLYDKTIAQIENLLAQLSTEQANAPKAARSHYDFEYKYINKVNSLTELALKVYLRLGEQSNALSFFDVHYREKSEEVKLYILVTLLFKEGKPDLIRQSIDSAKTRGVQPRKSLSDLYHYIEMNSVLPERLS